MKDIWDNIYSSGWRRRRGRPVPRRYCALLLLYCYAIVLLCIIARHTAPCLLWHRWNLDISNWVKDVVSFNCCQLCDPFGKCAESSFQVAVNWRIYTAHICNATCSVVVCITVCNLSFSLSWRNVQVLLCPFFCVYISVCIFEILFYSVYFTGYILLCTFDCVHFTVCRSGSLTCR